MRIKLNLQIFLFLLIFYFTDQINIYVTAIFFVLVHEVAHILVGVLLGLRPKLLNITPFGISILFEKYKRNGKKMLEKQKILVAIAGPAINIILAVIFILLPTTYFINFNQIELIYVNLILAGINLLPIYPLDGGRILKSLLIIKNIDKKFIIDIIERIGYITLICLTGLASICILILKNIALFFIIGYLWIIIIRQIEYNRLKRRMYEVLSNKKAF